MKRMSMVAMAALLLLAGCGRAQRAFFGVSNVIVINEEQPDKIASSNEFDTVVQDGVVLRVNEISYWRWYKEDDWVIRLPCKSVKVILYADWLDIAGDEQVRLPELDVAAAEQIFDNGDTMNDAANSTLEFLPDMQKANSRIIYEWFPPEFRDTRPVLLRLPISFSGEGGRKVEIVLEVELKGYPW